MILAKPAFPHKFGPYQMISQQVKFCYKAVVTAVNSMTETQGYVDVRILANAIHCISQLNLGFAFILWRTLLFPSPAESLVGVILALFSDL